MSWKHRMLMIKPLNNKRIKSPWEIEHEQRIAELENLLWAVGVCPNCKQLFRHYMDEPFADCACGVLQTGEIPLISKIGITPEIEKLWAERLNKSLSLGGT
jgi:hypothetical protein